MFPRRGRGIALLICVCRRGIVGIIRHRARRDVSVSIASGRAIAAARAVAADATPQTISQPAPAEAAVAAPTAVAVTIAAVPAVVVKIVGIAQHGIPLGIVQPRVVAEQVRRAVLGIVELAATADCIAGGTAIFAGIHAAALAVETAASPPKPPSRAPPPKPPRPPPPPPRAKASWPKAETANTVNRICNRRNRMNRPPRK